jgi:LacI family transcriptional regulator
MKEKHMTLPVDHLIEGQFDSDWGHDAILRLIMKDKEFDALFCGNDLIALGVLKGLQENKYMIPKDVGVVGFDDIHMAKMVTPELTTVRQPKYEMGYHAAELLIKMIQGIQTDQHDYVLKTVFIKRGSTR